MVVTLLFYCRDVGTRLSSELADVSAKEGALGPVHQEKETCPDGDLFAEIDRSPHVLGADASVDQALTHIQRRAATTNVGQRSEMFVVELRQCCDCHRVILDRVENVDPLSDEPTLLACYLCRLF